MGGLRFTLIESRDCFLVCLMLKKEGVLWMLLDGGDCCGFQILKLGRIGDKGGLVHIEIYKVWPFIV